MEDDDQCIALCATGTRCSNKIALTKFCTLHTDYIGYLEKKYDDMKKKLDEYRKFIDNEKKRCGL